MIIIIDINTVIIIVIVLIIIIINITMVIIFCGPNPYNFLRYNLHYFKYYLLLGFLTLPD